MSTETGAQLSPVQLYLFETMDCRDVVGIYDQLLIY